MVQRKAFLAQQSSFLSKTTLVGILYSRKGMCRGLKFITKINKYILT